MTYIIYTSMISLYLAGVFWTCAAIIKAYADRLIPIRRAVICCWAWPVFWLAVGLLLVLDLAGRR